MISARLREQGLINLYRKLLLRLVSIGLLAYLIYGPVRWPLPAAAVVAARAAGYLLVFAGVLGRALAILTIGGHKDRTIVRTESYSICRNPLYFASFLMAMGVGLASARLDFLVLVAGAYLVIFIPMMLNEANYLRARFADYAAYELAVPLFFPRPSLWQERKTFEINFRLVKRTVIDGSLTLVALPIVIHLRDIC